MLLPALLTGEGAVVQEGLHKVAVYKGQDGSVTRRSAMCPHVGCLLEWNTADCEW